MKAGILALLIASAPVPAVAADPCDAPVTDPIACENAKPGNPASEWDVNGSGSASIQGFATAISVDQGQTVRFKVDTAASAYRLDIYRMGYYGGLGARRITTVQPSAPLPQRQPNCLTDGSTGLVDCGNWAESASWAVPEDAVSGIYFAKLVREDGTAGASHVVFVVRDDDSRSDLLFQTADTTWQAYNGYGGNSLYFGQPDGRAYKVSYNRPFVTRDCCAEDWVFNAEYPMVRWLERNGYDVSYTTGVDTDLRGEELLEHKAFLSVGHDEYWSGRQRANVEAARDAGVHLAFFSGNEVFWKTRWEPSIDGSGASHRTLVSYKETHADDKIDPDPAWTGTWRDPRFSPPSDGGRPENALSGTIFTVNGVQNDPMYVPAADGRMRFWRNTSIAALAAGQRATLPTGVLGYEWDEDLDNGHRPPGLVRLSTSSFSGKPVIQDYGSTYGSGEATHHLTLYRDASGALVFGAGTVQWSWGLDDQHDRGGNAADPRMQQATVNLFADMGVQAGTLQAGLVAASPSTDTTAPTSTVATPAEGASLRDGDTITVTGTATDAGGGVVGGVEVSVDGGATWHPAEGRESWSYDWRVAGTGTWTILVRAVDDSGNLEDPPAARSGELAGATCPCSIWGDGATPAGVDPDTAATEVGVKFRTSEDGVITGVRFHKASTNTGTHVGHLWTASGELLASATFTNETATGWQQVAFPAPVPVVAGTTYVASYHAPNGQYSADVDYFAASGVSTGPLTALQDGIDGPNGLYAYGPAGSFPASGWRSANYWVDVVFEPGAAPPDTTPPSVTSTDPADGASEVAVSRSVSAVFDEALDPATVTLELADTGGAAVAGTTTYDAATSTATFTPDAELTAATGYTAEAAGADLAGNAMATPHTWSFTTRDAAGATCPCSIWDDTDTPAVASKNDRKAVALGVKFRADEDGAITGVRFYKGPDNSGTHVGHLWTTSGELLASATFTNETATGWQQVSFPAPVPVVAGATYVASYHAPNGRYAIDRDFFASQGVVNGPLEALADGIDGGNGVYGYGTSGTFPSSTWRSANYWVDVVFSRNA